MMPNSNDPSDLQARPKINRLSANPVDAKRIRVLIEFDPPTSPVNLTLSILDANDQILATSMMMGMTDQNIEFTLHIRSGEYQTPIRLIVQSSIPEGTLLEEKMIPIAL